MKPERQRIKIAEARGWDCDPKDAREWESRGQWVVSPLDKEKLVSKSKLPDYLNDLNAMHEAIYITLRSVDGRKFELFCSYLWAIMLRERKPHCICSNASEQAEAFLRTLNLWEE